MELFAQSDYKLGQLQILNECRMFLQAITLADITSADGKSVRADAYQGINRGIQANNYEFPR